GGRSLPHAMLMLVPSAWEQNNLLSEKLRDFYRYHACFMEPWDGPAAIAATDGIRIGAALDRNGLRPARYIVTKKGFVVMASEVGVLDVPAQDIEISGRLEPGKIFFIDTEERRIIKDEELKYLMASRQPYGDWIRDHLVYFNGLPDPKRKPVKTRNLFSAMRAYGYTREDLKIILKPMAETGKEPVGSMGNDAPHAVLSKKPQLLYNYFKQLFAQVTNPPIDSIREELVMSLDSFLGAQKNILEETPDHCHKLWIKKPVLTNEEVAKLHELRPKGFKTATVSLLFEVPTRKAGQENGKAGRTSNAGEKEFRKAIERICSETERAIEKGFSIVILSDRGLDETHAALPALLAMGAVHQHLVKKTLRTRVGIVVESGEPREVHHFVLLFGYGADCVNPYLAFEAVENLIAEEEPALDSKTALKNYRKALHEGILKVLSKMGISTIQSYRGAQIFEALGLGGEAIEKCFTGTASRIGGAGFAVLARETLLRHAEGFRPGQDEVRKKILNVGGFYQWRRGGEFHLWNPETVAALQDATWKGDEKRYREFSEMINDQSAQPTTLRSLLKFKPAKPVSIEEVEPVENILKRFATGAMSFGSISRGTHETLAMALNRIGGRSNSGEGGEDPVRFAPLPNGDSKRSAIKQVASGRFGVTANYLVNADELQIKIAQGAKPGEGGQLPGHKVSVQIAKIRYTTPGVTLISPPPHHDIYSIEDLAQLIFDLKNANPRARISVKLVSEVGVGTVAAGVAKGHADMILISGGDGGTGASPLSSIKHAGLPWELGLSETNQTLVLNDLRSRVRLQTDGQLRTGRDVAIAALLGAEEYGFSTAALIVLGCVMLRHCHLNNCSVGVATQDDLLEGRFKGRIEALQNYFRFVAQELRQYMAAFGIRNLNEMIGRTDLLEVNADILPWKAKALDFSGILYKPAVPSHVGTYCQISQKHEIDDVLDRKLIAVAQPAIQNETPVKESFPIENKNRTVGGMLSGEICRFHGEEGLPEDTVHFKFRGVAGQSFGAFLIRGATFELEGLANDYVGKCMSGGKIVIYPDRKAQYLPEQNIIIGNTTFYGATSGEVYIRGMAGERFCIRNSGVNAVVEGVGDHGCEYMTGGRVVVLGRTGRNFAAGMSGGVAYVYDVNGDFK
ncbi:MAG TPA: glutamate synthase large subunit, partial [Candidatus Omnitrophota bacterium]|nr:glutamate synthase large subunit [Candidatus Omnitrophota bacterium]